MIAPGFFYGQPDQDQQRNQMLAMTLMGHNANPATPYSGISNGLGNLAGAYAYKKATDPLAAVKVTPEYNQYGSVGRLFGFGGIGQ